MEQQENKSGREIIVDVLVQNEVDLIFGYPGGCVIPLFDELEKQNDKIRVIRTAHEQAATHAADGYARVTGKPGVVVVTSGPGATNAITGAATAQIDAIPMVVISGQVKRALLGTSAFQEVDAVGISSPITKKNYLAQSIQDLPLIINEAFQLAVSGRPGVVWIDIPVDLQLETTADWTTPKQNDAPLSTIEAPKEQVAKAWQMLNEAKRPILYIGGGVNKKITAPLVREFVAKSGFFVTSTLLGLGVVNSQDSQFLGMLGMHGEYAANKAVQEADVVLALGVRFDDRVTGHVDSFLPNAKIIHVDIDKTVLHKIKPVHLAIFSDAYSFLKQILLLTSYCKQEKWQSFCFELQKKHVLPFFATKKEYKKLRPEAILTTLSAETKGKAKIVTDVGQNQMFTALYYKFAEPLSHITSGGFGTMGFSLPAAIGVCFATNKKPVISISGDGGFQMNIQELITIKEYNLPIIMCVFNNGNLGMVKQWQDLFWHSQHAATILNEPLDFVAIAKAYGIMALRCAKEADLKQTIQQALTLNAPVLLEFIIDPEAHVYPMIPAGSTIQEVRLFDNREM